MAEMQSKTPYPTPPAPVAPPDSEEAQAFQRGLAAGREFAQTAVRRIGGWAEEHPGQVLLAGLGAGFILGKLLFPRRRVVISEELDD